MFHDEVCRAGCDRCHHVRLLSHAGDERNGSITDREYWGPEIRCEPREDRYERPRVLDCRAERLAERDDDIDGAHEVVEEGGHLFVVLGCHPRQCCEVPDDPANLSIPLGRVVDERGRVLDDPGHVTLGPFQIAGDELEGLQDGVGVSAVVLDQVLGQVADRVERLTDSQRGSGLTQRNALIRLVSGSTGVRLGELDLTFGHDGCRHQSRADVGGQRHALVDPHVDPHTGLTFILVHPDDAAHLLAEHGDCVAFEEARCIGELCA